MHLIDLEAVVEGSHPVNGCPPSSGIGRCTVETYGSGDLPALESSWRVLHASALRRSPFARWEWVVAWWTEYVMDHPETGGPASLLVLGVRSASGELLGLLPFHHIPSRPSALASWGLRPLGFLGKRYQEVTEEPVVAIRAGCERLVVETAVEYLLKRQAEVGWDFIQLQVQHPVDGLLQSPQIVEQAVYRRLLIPESTPSFSLSLPSTWEEFRCGLPKKMRDKITNCIARLGRSGREWHVDRVSDPLEIAKATDVLVHMHRARAASDHGVPHINHLPSKRHRLFVRDLSKRYAESGDAMMYILRCDGDEVAALLVLFDGDSAVLYQSGYLPVWHKLSPLAVLQIEIIKDCIAAGRRSLNFLRFGYEWKTRWGAKQESVFQQLIVLRPSAPSLLRTALYARNRSSRDEIETV